MYFKGRLVRVTKTQGAFAPTSFIVCDVLLADAQHHDLAGAFSMQLSVLLPAGAALQGWALPHDSKQ